MCTTDRTYDADMDDAPAFRMGRLDHVHIRVPDRAVAAEWYSAHLGFELAKAGATVALTGFSSPDIRIVDVTDAAAPVELSIAVGTAEDGKSATATASVPASPAGERLLRAFTTAQVAQPASITLNRPSADRSPPSFPCKNERLAAYKRDVCAPGECIKFL